MSVEAQHRESRRRVRVDDRVALFIGVERTQALGKVTALLGGVGGTVYMLEAKVIRPALHVASPPTVVGRTVCTNRWDVIL